MGDLTMRMLNIEIALFVFVIVVVDVSGRFVMADAIDTRGGQVNTRKSEHRSTQTFSLREGNRIQSLVVDSISEYKINFTLRIDGPCKKVVSGVAVGPKGDYEMEEDENGDSYPAIAYSFTGKEDYWLSVSLAVETKGYKRDKAIVLESGDKSGCPAIVKTMHVVK